MSKLTLSGTLEEESDHQDLQPSHSYHHQNLNQREIEDPRLCALNSTEVSVFSCSEIFLHPADCA